MNFSEKINVPFKFFLSFLLLLIPIILLTSCLTNHQEKMYHILAGEDMLRSFRINEIQERGKLIAITDYSPTDYIAKSEVVSFNGKKISQYDEIIRNISKQYNLDWRLVASLIYQESQFHSDVRSWAGAFGLMQMMPATAALFGIDSTASEFEQLQAGIKYLKTLDRELPKEITNPEERIKFILASYNVGIAHVFDARRLAKKNGRDPNVWTENVDYYILNKSNPLYYRDSVVRYGYARGEEAYNFVLEVLDRFEDYKNTIAD